MNRSLKAKCREIIFPIGFDSFQIGSATLNVTIEQVGSADGWNLSGLEVHLTGESAAFVCQVTPPYNHIRSTFAPYTTTCTR